MHRTAKSDDAPPAPSLSLLAYSNVKTGGQKTMATPKSLLAKWHDHSIFANDFRKFLADLREQHALDIAPSVSPKKNGGGDGAEASEPAKKRRRGAGGEAVPGMPPKEDAEELESAIVELDAIPTILTEAVCMVKQKTVLAVTVGHGAFLINREDSPIAIPVGTTLGGYWKGTFRNLDFKTETKPGSAEVAFQLSSCEDHVFIGSKWLELQEVMNSKRLLSPTDAHVAYHKLIDAPTSDRPAGFTVKPLDRICVLFKAETPAKSEGADADATATVPASHICGSLPSEKWSASTFLDFCWHVKWPAVASKGLQPIRPVLVASRPLQIPAKKALKVVPPEAA